MKRKIEMHGMHSKKEDVETLSETDLNAASKKIVR